MKKAARPPHPSLLRVGVDTGGTFTDFILVENGRARVHKVLSTPTDPARAILGGLRELLGGRAAAPVDLTHGSTVATNSLLTRRGAR
ncbi:MAG: hypothetical protein HYR52_03985, partial [Candidatus Tectomicrobia bacterium]|nr:hypothetical protein [Candidatus Tectomicrobia bacterium]